ncbi:MAG: Fic family protein [Gemmatimonadetes bacterium]|nr:Fic family protein [Gemmatimonadota bacterium]
MQPFRPQPLPRQDLDWAGLLPAIGEANRAIARFDGILHGVPNAEVLLAPLATQEAVLSSRIEGTRATLTEVLRFDAGEPEAAGTDAEHEDIREVLNYRSALRHAQTHLAHRPFSLNLLRQLRAILLGSVRGRSRARGEFRRVQNWIGPPGAPLDRAVFVPPSPELVPGLLDNWEKYYHAEERDPLVQLALLHAQFEIIHPFLDGNGRLGRIVIPLFLYERGILGEPVFYLSAYLEAHRDEYVNGLRALNGDEGWTRWVRFFLEAISAQATSHAATARSIMELYDRLKDRVIEVTRSQYAVPLLDRLFVRPIVSSTDLVNAPGMPSKPMVMRLLKKLRGAGILTVVREGSGRRAQVLALAELLELCDAQPPH